MLLLLQCCRPLALVVGIASLGNRIGARLPMLLKLSWGYLAHCTRGHLRRVGCCKSRPLLIRMRDWLLRMLDRLMLGMRMLDRMLRRWCRGRLRPSVPVPLPF